MRMWRSEFKSSYLEEISKKTGQQLSYCKFVQMIVQAFRGTDKSVYIDLLDLNDLQLLKGKAPTNQVEDPRNPQKRYLILTNLN
jgi:hypothetical protein